MSGSVSGSRPGPRVAGTASRHDAGYALMQIERQEAWAAFKKHGCDFFLRQRKRVLPRFSGLPPPGPEWSQNGCQSWGRAREARARGWQVAVPTRLFLSPGNQVRRDSPASGAGRTAEPANRQYWPPFPRAVLNPSTSIRSSLWAKPTSRAP